MCAVSRGHLKLPVNITIFICSSNNSNSNYYYYELLELVIPIDDMNDISDINISRTLEPSHDDDDDVAVSTSRFSSSSTVNSSSIINNMLIYQWRNGLMLEYIAGVTL